MTRWPIFIFFVIVSSNLSSFRGKWVHLEGCSTTRQLLQAFAHFYGCKPLPVGTLYDGNKGDACTWDERWLVKHDVRWLGECREQNDILLAKCENETYVSFMWKNYIFTDTDADHYARLLTFQQMLQRRPDVIVIENGAIHELDDTQFANTHTAIRDLPLDLVWRIIRRAVDLLNFIKNRFVAAGIPAVLKGSNEFCLDDRRTVLSLINNITLLAAVNGGIKVIDMFNVTGASYRCANVTNDRWHHWEYQNEIMRFVFSRLADA